MRVAAMRTSHNSAPVQYGSTAAILYLEIAPTISGPRAMRGRSVRVFLINAAMTVGYPRDRL